MNRAITLDNCLRRFLGFKIGTKSIQATFVSVMVTLGSDGCWYKLDNYETIGFILNCPNSLPGENFEFLFNQCII